VTVATIIIGFLYFILILWFIIGIKKVPLLQANRGNVSTHFSIIIPFRNESKHLPELLASINALNYPKTMFEVLLIDDDSNDDSIEIITEFITSNSHLSLSILPNERQSKSPKKDAITTAIKHAKHHWIITTDADCIVPPKWLLSIDTLIQEKQPECIAGPVTYIRNNRFLNAFQLLDFHSLQGVTIGAFGQQQPFLCNGANLAYKKDAFYSVNGFSENNTIASGDDIFLMEKIIKQIPKKVHYLKSEDAIVHTNAQNTWSKLTHQRVRWAAKTSAYNNFIGKFTALTVILTNTCLVFFFIGFVTTLLSFKFFSFLMLIKLIIDFFILYKMALFFRQKDQLKYFLQSSFLYPFFSMYVAFKSIFFDYEWKGRKFNK